MEEALLTTVQGGVLHTVRLAGDIPSLVTHSEHPCHFTCMEPPICFWLSQTPNPRRDGQFFGPLGRVRHWLKKGDIWMVAEKPSIFEVRILTPKPFTLPLEDE